MTIFTNLEEKTQEELIVMIQEELKETYISKFFTKLDKNSNINVRVVETLYDGINEELCFISQDITLLIKSNGEVRCAFTSLGNKVLYIRHVESSVKHTKQECFTQTLTITCKCGEKVEIQIF